jgi:Bacteriophage protein gp37
MNKTKIEWCDSTWNPVTGCLHGCEYCYARKIIDRFGGASETHCNETVGTECQWETEGTGILHDLSEPIYDVDRGHNAPYPFYADPTFHRYRLEEPKGKQHRNIFVVSMGDLFGWWVPNEWIMEIYRVCEAARQHNYLFLTKNPARYRETEKLPIYDSGNRWYGTTVTKQEDVIRLRDLPSRNFVSIEPMMERIDLEDVPRPKWVILGAESGNRRGKITPELDWINSIVDFCAKEMICLFMKDSLIPIIGEENMKRQMPDAIAVRAVGFKL